MFKKKRKIKKNIIKVLRQKRGQKAKSKSESIKQNLQKKSGKIKVPKAL